MLLSHGAARDGTGQEGEMAFENFRLQIAMLMDEIARNPGDAHELQESLREKLAEMQSLGLSPPADLVGLEEYLEDDLDRANRRRAASEAPPEET
jgi:hypothetical protein